MVRLGDVCEFVYGYPFDSGKFNTTGEGLALIRIRDVVPGVSYTFTTEAVPPKYFVKDGDLLVGMDGDFNLSRWKGGKALLNQRVCMFKPNEKLILAGYIEFGLGQYLSDIWENKSFSTVKHLSAKDLNAITFPLPPLSEQKEIVARLERELATVEKMKKDFEALAETAKAEFKAELKEVFEGLKRDGMWMRMLEEVGEIVTGTTPSKSNKDFYGGSWPFYKPTDLNQGYDTVESSDTLTDSGWRCARQLPVGSVLVTCIGATLGKTGIIRCEGSCNQQINAIVCNEHALPEYVYYSILEPSFQSSLWRASNSTTLPLVNKSTFSRLEISLPALSVQRQTVARLSAAKARAEKLEAKARAGVAVCETMRKAILKEAFE